MNIDQLMEAMAESDPNPGTVLDLVHRKRRAARNRVLYATASGAAVLAVVVGVVLTSLASSTQPRSTASSAGSRAGSASGQVAAPLASGPRSAANQPAGLLGPASQSGTCTQPALGSVLDQAVGSGASVIVGSARLAASPAGHAVSRGSATYYPVTLSSVRTLAGPTVASGAVAWIIGASPGATPGPGQAAPSPDRQVLAIVSPSGGSGLPGPVLQAAPVDHGEVIVGGGGCLDMVAYPATTPAGLSVTPGSSPTAHPASPEIPLAAAEQLAARA